MPIDANDIGAARELNAREIDGSGGVNEWFRSQGFAADDIEDCSWEATRALVEMALNGDAGLGDLFFAAFRSGVALGWTLHRDHAEVIA